MVLLRRLLGGLSALVRPEETERQLDDELRAYMEASAEEKMKAGLSREEARRAVRLEMGGMDSVKESVRSAGWETAFSSFLRDVRFAARMLRKSPGFTIVAVITLALGIGANTAIFSAVNPILFEPLPYPHPERIMMVWSIFQGARSQLSFHNYREIAERSHSFEAVAILEPWQPTITGPGEPERLDGQSVSWGYFRALGVPPAVGRDFEPRDNAFHGANVAILSYGLWQRRFGGDREIVGRQVTLDGDGYTVVGIMPRGFDNVLSPTAEIWSPEHYDPSNITDTNTGEWGNHLRLVARLLPDAGLAQAKADIEAIAHNPIAEFPRPRWASLRLGFIVDSLQNDVTRGVRPALLAVLGAVVLVLTIACVNVTNLLLARGAQRRGEFAMRAALGASRARMIRQLLTESVMVALIGGGLGLIVAQIGVRALLALCPPDLPRLSAIGLDRNVFLFALGVTALIGLAVGAVPAIHASCNDPHAGLKGSSRQVSTGHQRTRRVLVVAEVALALILLVGTGLLLRSLARLFAVDPGFDVFHLQTMQVQAAGRKFDDPDKRRRFFAQALDEVRRTPGVDAAAFSSLLPLTDDTQFGVYGATFEKDDKSYSAFRYVVCPGYFETMRIPLRRGRFLNERDTANAPHAVLLSESLARKEFGTQDPIGQRARVGGFPGWPWYTVVGVVGDVKQESLAASDPNAVYITPEQSWFADQAMSLVVRTGAGDAALIPELKKAVWSVDKDQPVVRVARMETLLSATAAERRFTLVLFELFGIVALVLAAVGIYGVLSGSVAERTHEIGIRSALGASRAAILSLVVRQGLALTALGILFGFGGALAASRAIVSLLFGVSPLDPVTDACVIILLASVSFVACWLPARRASHVEPVEALRCE